jgi:hypothetical protein
MKKFAGVFLSIFCLLFFLISARSAEPTEIGAEKCAKMCHKDVYESWLKTKHANLKHKVDCESCHGKGSEYAKMWIMKDKEAAKAAGLVAKPDKTSCESCHKKDFKEEMLKLCH